MSSALKPVRELLDLQARITHNARALERLGPGALSAFTGGAIVLGVFGGGLLWIPAGMAAALSLYRVGEFFYRRDEYRRRREADLIMDVAVQKNAIQTLPHLDDGDRRLLSGALDDTLDASLRSSSSSRLQRQRQSIPPAQPATS